MIPQLFFYEKKLNVEHNPKLTSSELANLWSSYISDSLNISIMEVFLSTVEDNEIQEILQHSKKLSEGHLNSISTILIGKKSHRHKDLRKQI